MHEPIRRVGPRHAANWSEDPPAIKIDLLGLMVVTGMLIFMLLSAVGWVHP